MQSKFFFFATIIFLSACQSARVVELVMHSKEENKRTKPGIDYKMHVIVPDSSIQYKALQIEPDSSIQYHMLIVKPEP